MFFNENGEEIEDEFIYEVGESEKFYLYNWDGPIEITQGESNVTPIKENERYKFKITNYTESFKYRIAIVMENINLIYVQLMTYFMLKKLY